MATSYRELRKHELGLGAGLESGEAVMNEAEDVALRHEHMFVSPWVDEADLPSPAKRVERKSKTKT